MVKGSAYEQVTRQMVVDVKETMNTGFGEVKKDLKEIKDENKTMFNHMSSRLPHWATILFTILTGLVVGVGVKLLG